MYINWIQYLFQMRMKTGDSSFLAVRAGLQNVLQIFVTNAANVFLLEVSPEYPILLEEQVKKAERFKVLISNVNGVQISNCGRLA